MFLFDHEVMIDYLHWHMKTQEEVVKNAYNLFFRPDKQLDNHDVSAIPFIYWIRHLIQMLRIDIYSMRKLSELNGIDTDDSFISL